MHVVFFSLPQERTFMAGKKCHGKESGRKYRKSFLKLTRVRERKNIYIAQSSGIIRLRYFKFSLVYFRTVKKKKEYLSRKQQIMQEWN